MRILMVNDDGYASYGIKRLAERLSAEHEVTVIAPAKCNSGMAHAMTFGKPIFLKKIEKYPTECYSLSGTPADCVKFGMEFIKEKIDLVISGINTEPNIGTTVVYSGTAAAAMEASLYKVKAIAVSANPEKESDYEGIIDFFLANFDYYLSLCSENYAINININNHKIGNKGHKFVSIGNRPFTDIYLVGESNEQGISHTLVGDPIEVENSVDSDVYAYSEGYATITPLTSDHTDYNVLKAWKTEAEKSK